MSFDEAFNFRKMSEEICTAGLLNKDQICPLGAEGYESVINFLPKDSEYALSGEKELIENQDLVYRHISVTFNPPHRDDYREFETAMNALQGKKIVIHSAANYRVFAFYARYACRNPGWSVAKAKRHIASLWDPIEHDPWGSFIAENVQNYNP